MVHFLRPVKFWLQVPVTQVFAAISDKEPWGFRYPDGSIGYVWRPGAVSGRWHNGVDYGAACGSMLVAPGGGYIHASGLDDTGFGLRVIGKSRGYLWLLAHLRESLVTVGEGVKGGALVAYSGGAAGEVNSGNSTGCHLHFSIMSTDGRYLDPWPFVHGK